MGGRLLTSVPGAPWLPAGSTAEVHAWDGSPPPEPVCLVRALVRRGDEFLLVDTPKGLDLPTRFVAQQPTDGQWRAAITGLARELGGSDEWGCIGFVRNVVPDGAEDYPFPTPHAHFVVFELAEADVAPHGTFLSLAEAEPHCRDRHWWPVVADRLTA